MGQIDRGDHANYDRPSYGEALSEEERTLFKHDTDDPFGEARQELEDTEEPDKAELEQTAVEMAAEGEPELTFEDVEEGPMDAVSMYIREAKGIPRLSADQHNRLAERIGEGDLGALRQLIEANLMLVVWRAYKLVGRGLPLADLIQEGNLGLIRAAQKFSAKKGTEFSTYAAWWIKQAMYQALDNDRLVHLPIYLQIEVRKLRRLSRRYYAEHGKQLTREHAQAVYGTISNQVWETYQHMPAVGSLDRLLADGETPFGDILADPREDNVQQKSIEAAELQMEITEYLGVLTVRERLVIEYRFLEKAPSCRNLSLAEVSRYLNITPPGVASIQHRALGKLRKAIGNSLQLLLED
jgi:RNA polymerase sigma factor (sigma-70 family)